MNVFVIPSWYPSADFPFNGIFIKEQLVALSKVRPELNIGVSRWGQKDEKYLLWVGRPIESFKKYIFSDLKASSRQLLAANLVEYVTPAFSWSRKILKGNMGRIVAANEENLRKFSQEFGPVEVIHAHVGYPAGWIALQLSEKLGIPYVLTEHQGPFPLPSLQKNGELISYARKSLECAHGLIAVGEALQRKIKHLTGKEVIYVPNMVDEDFFCPLEKANSASFTFFALGRITAMKGFDLLLMTVAAQKAFFEQHHIRLRIGGGGKESEKFKALAFSLGIEHLVVWLGLLSREQVVEEFQHCNAFVLPSRHESFGVVYAEALACGRPVIATQCGGAESIITEEVGYLVPVGDQEQLGWAMVKMVKEYDQFEPGRIRTYFMEKFSRRVVAGQIVDVYKSAIKNGV